MTTWKRTADRVRNTRRVVKAREWAYDNSPLGRLEKGLEEAKAHDWTVVDMKNDWEVIYPFEKK